MNVGSTVWFCKFCKYSVLIFISFFPLISVRFFSVVSFLVSIEFFISAGIHVYMGICACVHVCVCV